MRKLFVLLLSLATQCFAENTRKNSEGQEFIESCKHALEILQATTPRLIDFQASVCIDKVFQYSSATYLAKQNGAISDICIGKELAVPTRDSDLRTISIPVKAITDFTEKYPEALQFEPRVLIVAAFAEAFPCNETPETPGH